MMLVVLSFSINTFTKYSISIYCQAMFLFWIAILSCQQVYGLMQLSNNSSIHDEHSGHHMKHHTERASMEEEKYANVFEKYLSDDHTIFRMFRPNYTEDPITIEVDLTVVSFGSINLLDQTVRIDLFLRQYWNDYRYKHSLAEKITPLMGSKQPSDYLWVPDTSIRNSRSSKKTHFAVHSDKLDIQPDGSIKWSTMMSVTTYCSLDFRNYPMDSQKCSVGFESYAYDASHIRYKWRTSKHVFFSSRYIPQFELTNYFTENIFSEYVAGNYSSLLLTFEFQRQLPHSIMNIFFPSVAVVSVSWVSLWIHKKSTSARVGTGITTLLTLTGIWTGVNRGFPRVDYVKAIDVYFMVSFIFILLTLVEYTAVAFVNFPLWKMRRYYREFEKVSKSQATDRKTTFPITNSTQTSLIRQSIRKYPFGTITTSNSVYPGFSSVEPIPQQTKPVTPRSARQEYPASDSGVDSDDSSSEVRDVKDAHLYNPKTASLDIISRVAFPFCYVCFLVYFWTHYAVYGGGKDESNMIDQ